MTANPDEILTAAEVAAELRYPKAHDGVALIPFS